MISANSEERFLVRTGEPGERPWEDVREVARYNLVYVAHNVRIGKRCRVAANAAIGGSTTLGDEVYVGPGAAISSELRVGAGAVVSLGAVVTRDVLPGQRVSGNFALDHERFIAHMRQIR